MEDFSSRHSKARQVRVKKKVETKRRYRRFTISEYKQILWLFYGRTEPPFDMDRPMLTVSEVARKMNAEHETIRQMMKRFKAVNCDVETWVQRKSIKGTHKIPGLTLEIEK